jgi:hypothetical protein
MFNFSFNQIHRGWHYLAVMFLLLGIFAVVLYDPLPAQADACPGQPCFGGYVTNQANNDGSSANILTVDPNLGCCGFRGSFVLILTLGDTGVGSSAFVQTGIAKTINGGCGPRVVLISEFIDRSGSRSPFNDQIIQHCEKTIYPGIGTTHTYTNEYDPITDYWCHDYDGICQYSEPRLYDAINRPNVPATGYLQGSQVSAYGETTDNTIQIGATSQQTVLSQIKYKNYADQTFYYFTIPPYGPGPYNVCDGGNPNGGNMNGPNNCPNYRRNQGGAAGDGNKWFVEVWTV